MRGACSQPPDAPNPRLAWRCRVRLVPSWHRAGSSSRALPGGAPRCARPFSTPDRSLSASPGPEAVPSHAPGMTDAPRDAGPKQAAPARPEKPAADFGYVGIDAILEQMRRKAMKQGFEFNIMVVGERSPRPSCRPRAQRAVSLLLGQRLSSPCPPRAQHFSSVAVALLQEPANPASRGLPSSQRYLKPGWDAAWSWLWSRALSCRWRRILCRHVPKERALGGARQRRNPAGGGRAVRLTAGCWWLLWGLKLDKRVWGGPGRAGRLWQWCDGGLPIVSSCGELCGAAASGRDARVLGTSSKSPGEHPGDAGGPDPRSLLIL